MTTAHSHVATAVISEDGQYRYRLTRRWDAGPTATFIMLNPSTADAYTDDPTIRRCIGFAQREGCGALLVVNVFAYRATDPAELKWVVDATGPENARHIAQALNEADGPVIAAWGASGVVTPKYVDRVIPRSRSLLCLGATASGAPRHPLYVRRDEPLGLWFRSGWTGRAGYRQGVS